MLADPAIDHGGHHRHGAGDVDLAIGVARQVERWRQFDPEAMVRQADDAHAGELQPEWLQDKARVGLTAGASAPEVLVQEVIAKIKSMGAVAVRKMDGIQETVKFPLPKGLKL